MTDVAKMTLKILYSLDNGSGGTYLARSKAPHTVRLASIPSSDGMLESDSNSFKIGAVHLSLVLQEIFLNSPEILSHHNSKNGYDYNLYYRDICELDEPLVSLGLLSQLRQKIDKCSTRDAYQLQDTEDEEPLIVTGRVCSNFAALLKNSYESRRAAGEKRSFSSSSDTLEIKLRFIGVVTGKNSRKSSTYNTVLPKVPIATTGMNPSNFKNSNPAPKVIRPVKNLNSAKRQTNPTPAPKAERTQSLPIWSLKQGANNTGLPTNSIAHRIFLADRKTESGQAKTFHQPTTYQVNALQQDNTVQKYRVDDSVSRRFDFMSNRKKKQQNQPQQSQLQQRSRSITNNTEEQGKIDGFPKKTTAVVKARRFNTMAGIPTPSAEITQNNLKNIISQKQRSGSVSIGGNHEQKSACEELLVDSLSKEQLPLSMVNQNKENVPPQNVPTDEIDLDLLNFTDIGLKSDLDWFGNYDPFNMPDVLLQHDLKPTTTTPKDPNTCNTVGIESGDKDDSTPEIRDNGKLDEASDVDRTSPMDTLSMPLMELNERSTTRMVSCQEQLRRLPLLGHQIKGRFTEEHEFPTDSLPPSAEDEENNEDDDATSIVIQYSSSFQDNLHLKKEEIEKKISLSQSSSPIMKRCHDNLDQEDDEEQQENLKKQRIMPSSPTLFTYQDDSSNAGDENDLFSSFIAAQNGQNNDADSTPATQYQNQSSDHMKS